MNSSRYLEMLEESGLNLIVFNGGEIVFSSGSGGFYPSSRPSTALIGRVSES